MKKVTNAMNVRRPRSDQYAKRDASDRGGEDVETVYETVVGEGRRMVR